MPAKRLKTLHCSPAHSNASINRDLAIRCLKAGMTPQQIATEWPKVWRCDAAGKLGQIYDSQFEGSEIKETRYTITRESVDKAIARLEVSA